MVSVRELYAAFRRGDVSGILAMLRPDVEWCEPKNPFNPAAGHRRGAAGFLEWLRIGRESEEIITGRDTFTHVRDSGTDRRLPDSKPLPVMPC